MDELKFMLPYPIGLSVNKIWCKSRLGIYLNPAVVRYRKEVLLQVFGLTKLGDNPLSLDIKMSPPDKRKRDIDNILKVTLDTLQFCKVFDDDNQIMILSIQKFIPRPPGKLEILIKTL